MLQVSIFYLYLFNSQKEKGPSLHQVTASLTWQELKIYTAECCCFASSKLVYAFLNLVIVNFRATFIADLQTAHSEYGSHL